MNDEELFHELMRRGHPNEYFIPTTKLRWLVLVGAERSNPILQQQWIGDKGTTDWCNIPVVELYEMGAHDDSVHRF